MAQQHLNTMMQQARAFLEAREPADAMRLLKQARMLARDDVATLAEVYATQSKAAVMMNRGDDAVAYIRQAIALDRNQETQLSWLIEQCAARGLDRAGVALRALGHMTGQSRTGRGTRRFLTLTALVLLMGLVVGGLYWSGLISFDPAQDGDAGAARLDFARVRDNVGLVVVTAKYNLIDGRSVTLPIATGSCFAVSENGFLLTNQHVTGARNDAPEQLKEDGRLQAQRDWWKITVCFSSDSKDHHEARLVYESAYRDVAVLKIERTFPKYLRRAKEWAPGDDVYAAGYPGAVSEAMAARSTAELIRNIATELGKADADFSLLPITDAAYEVTITRGVISAVRKIEGQEHVQTDAVVTSGNSGGPLLTRDCRVVGINTWVTTQSEAYNFALTLEEMLGELRPFVAVE